MIELLLATALTCHESQEVIDSLRQYQTLSEYREELIDNLQGGQMEYREEIIDTVKLNTEPGCYEGSERNS